MPMTTTATDLDLHYRKPHRRNDSGELAVFEATRYFSGEADESCNHASSLNSFAVYSRDVREGCSVADDYLNAKATYQPRLHKQEKESSEKKAKTRKSAGSKLITGLLNSLFSAAAGKKMPKQSRMVAARDCDESPCDRRRRRSSISHLQSVSDNSAKSSYYSSSVSAFEAPSSDSSISRFCKEFNDIKKHEKMKFCPRIRRTSLTLIPSTGEAEKKCMTDAFLDQSFIFSESFLAREGSNYKRCLRKEKECNQDDDLISACLRKGINHDMRSGGEISREKGCQKWSTPRPWEKRPPIRKMDAEEEDGFMSDSSSDLFELQNYDLGRDFTCQIPVCETEPLSRV